ncbi:MAG: sulfatase-like hydrolase/transferase, partial [Candidatus Cyclobacteriaceae bacterium M3_2C_046]
MFSCTKNEKNSQNQSTNPPNIIYILADDMGYQDWGAYGQEILKTPVLDQLAAEGMRFTDHYAGAPVCAPSRSVLMTGLHPGHTPIRGNDRDMEIGVAALPRETPTIAEVLKQNSQYTTALCGRWHLGGEKSQQQPSMRGFDYTFGKLSGFVKGENSFFVKNMFDENGKHLPESEYKNIGEPLYENG